MILIPQPPFFAGLSGYVAADYIRAWLEVLCADEKAIFRAASAASKAADFLLACGEDRP